MDPVIIVCLITSVSSLVISVFTKIKSSRCCGDKGLNLELTNGEASAIHK